MECFRFELYDNPYNVMLAVILLNYLLKPLFKIGVGKGLFIINNLERKLTVQLMHYS